MQTAKLFMNGRSQAIRLPEKFRFKGDKVFIWKDKKSGHLILSKKPDSWDDFFKLVEKSNIPDDFMTERDNEILQDRQLFSCKSLKDPDNACWIRTWPVSSSRAGP